MEGGADTASVIMPRLQAAQLAGHMPNSFAVHKRNELVSIAARVGLDTARHVEAAMTAAADGGDGAGGASDAAAAAAPLSLNKAFQRYMGLRLQLHESAEVSERASARVRRQRDAGNSVVIHSSMARHVKAPQLAKRERTCPARRHASRHRI
jgi:hypothetical protein